MVYLFDVKYHRAVKCSMKTRHGKKRETNTVATVAHNKCIRLAVCCHSEDL